MTVDESVPVAVLALKTIFVFLVAGDLMHPQPFERIVLVGEVELVGQLAAIGIPLVGLAVGGRSIGAEEGAQEIRIGDAFEQALIDVDKHLTRRAVLVGLTENIS